MPFGPVTNILLAQKKKIRASLWLSLISGTVTSSEHVSNGPWLLPFPITDQSTILQKGGGFRVFMILINNIKIHSFTSLTGVVALQGNFVQ
jgi:hypothetical protein